MEVVYALNTKKGTTIDHPLVSLPGLVAVPVPLEIGNQLKNIHGIVIFDRIAGMKPELKISKPQDLYGLNKLKVK